MDNVRDPIQFRTELSNFTSIAPVLLNWSNKTSRVFPALKSTSHFLPEFKCLIDQIQVQKPILVVATDQSSIISIDSSIMDNMIRKAINVNFSRKSVAVTYPEFFWGRLVYTSNSRRRHHDWC